MDSLLDTILELAEMLFMRSVVKEDNFFSLGGDSLVAIDLAGSLEEQLGFEVAAELLFDTDDFATLAEILSARACTGTESVS